MNIFLAGDIKGEWQADAVAAIHEMRPDVEIYDPREHLAHDPKVYTKRDLTAIVDCDMVIAVIEQDHFRYAGIVFLVGFAVALGKKVLLVNERGAQIAHNMHQMCDVYPDVGGVYAALPYMEEFLE